MIQFFMGFTLGAIFGIVISALLVMAEREEKKENDAETGNL